MPKDDRPAPSEDDEDDDDDKPATPPPRKRTSEVLSPITQRRPRNAARPRFLTQMLDLLPHIGHIIQLAEQRHEDESPEEGEMPESQIAVIAAEAVGAIVSAAHIAISAAQSAQASDLQAQRLILAAATGYNESVASARPTPVITVPSPFDSPTRPPHSVGPQEMIVLTDTVARLANQVTALTTQVQAISERPQPRPQRATAQPAPPAGGKPASGTPATPPVTQSPPISYAQMAATPAPNTTSRAKPPKKPRLPPPPPTVYSKDPTLVLTPGRYIPPAQRKSGAALTAAAREYFQSLPTSSHVTVLSAVFNHRGNIVCTFAAKPISPTGNPVVTTLDSHAAALAAHMAKICTIGEQAADQQVSLTYSRVRPRSNLRISMVPTRDTAVKDSVPYTAGELLTELMQNAALKGLEFVVPPQFACQPGRLSELEFCPVAFSFVDRAGEIRARLLQSPRVWLFGHKLRLSVPPVRPAFSQCTKCQALGHTSKGCKAQRTCAHCAGKHATAQHRTKCANCAQDAVPATEDCPHPTKCSNCNGDHMATSSACPKRKKYANAPADDSAHDTHMHED